MVDRLDCVSKLTNERYREIPVASSRGRHRAEIERVGACGSLDRGDRLTGNDTKIGFDLRECGFHIQHRLNSGAIRQVRADLRVPEQRTEKVRRRVARHRRRQSREVPA